MSAEAGFASLYDLAGLTPAAPHEQARPILVAHARAFLEGGGTISLADWSRLSPPERAAFAAAGRQLRVEAAIDHGTASRPDGFGALKVRAKLDDGQAHDNEVLRRAVDAAHAALKAAP